MDWFLYDNGLRHERINIFLDISDCFLQRDKDFGCVKNFDSLINYLIPWLIIP